MEGSIAQVDTKRLTLVDKNWLWLAMIDDGDYGRQWLTTIGRKNSWLTIFDIGWQLWHWLTMVENCWLWLTIVTLINNGRYWLTLVENGKTIVCLPAQQGGGSFTPVENNGENLLNREEDHTSGKNNLPSKTHCVQRILPKRTKTHDF